MIALARVTDMTEPDETTSSSERPFGVSSSDHPFGVSSSVRPYGGWPSPISLDQAVSAGVTLRELGSDGAELYWLESVPGAQARLALMRHRGGVAQEVTEDPCSVRSRVDEYGGGAWAARGDTLVWCDDTTGQVMLKLGDGEARALTPAGRRHRYAAFVPCPERGVVIAVREDHTDPTEVVTTLVALPSDAPEGQLGIGEVIASGADFYADPAWDGHDLLAWVEWDQPSMPWDSTRLVVAPLAAAGENGVRLGPPVTVAGRLAPPAEGVSVQHPHWAPDGSLVFTSDATGWWNLHRWWPGLGGPPRRLAQEDVEEDQPMWQLGRHALAISGDWIYHELRDEGLCWLARTPLGGGQSQRIARFAAVDDVVESAGEVFALVRRADGPAALVRVGADASGSPSIGRVHRPSPEPDPGVTSQARSLSFTGRLGPVQCWYFAPRNDSFTAPPGDLPPVILTIHGGPTGTATGGYDPEVAFWTSRGFALLEVNYSGSAGFGRAYRERLRGQWGVADVDDCLDAVDMLVREGLADPRRVTIIGGSAGGFTVLACLTSSALFAAGVSRYGIGDLVALQSGGHKFEARYNDGLLGPWPQDRAVFEERSPINHLDRLATPMLLFQGLDDPVVPPQQAESMAQAVRARGLPVALVTFEGEGHGFRRPATRRRVLECELSFFAQLFGLAVSETLDDLVVENLRTGK